MSELKELIEKYIELEDNFDEDNEEQAEKLHDLGHEIDHAVYNEEFIIVYNADTEDEEVVALIISDEEDEAEEFFIPVYTSQEEAEKAIETFVEESGENNFAFDKAVGCDIVEAYSDDEEFLGLAVDAPQCDFVIFAESVHDCSE
ncbi:hypothetical protein [Methanobrevibacter sp.]|uniref:hypothetical protein n=1 Tax=Methanobrevibacter sp. TaxID=66852 RepID=UPI0025EAFDE6|nr:hypothetical protein [Methanobrevibacter sp.]MBQ2666095.1 hypothetical protein [Methanobrevibacter sp.]